MSGQDRDKPGPQKNGRKVEGELNLGNIKSTLRKDIRELKEFFLDEEHIVKLEKMGPFKGGLILSLWLLKALFLKLTFVRRLLLILAMILIFMNFSTTINLGNGSLHLDSNLKILGGLVLLFILMLELKDKLLAKDELKAGRSVQLALTPVSNPGIPGWDTWLYTRPANDVGGDLIDFIKIDERRFGLALGDVAGKGLPAALYMAKLQATLRALVTEFPSLAELGAKINGIFYRDSMSRSFASLIHLEIKRESGEINLLNAGHMPPLIIKGDHIQYTSKGDLALGILATAQYTEKSYHLLPGEFFVVYSDGVTEALDEEGEFFGQERFYEILKNLGEVSSAEAGLKILAQVERFCGEAPKHDDLSLMILKRL